MPPKGDKKKERLLQERLQREATEQAALMAKEAAGREPIEMLEVLERSEHALCFREGQIELMIDRRAYGDLLQKIEDNAQDHAKELQALEDELALTRRTKAKLERELEDIRVDHRMLAKSVPLQMKRIEASMTDALQKVIDFLEHERETESRLVMQSFHLHYGHNKQVYLDLLHEAHEKLGHFTQVLVEAKSMHSNIPTRIRRQLETSTKEELLFMIDALSFEETVLDYFEKKFPKPQPHRWPTTSASPNTLLLATEGQVAREAAERVSTP